MNKCDVLGISESHLRNAELAENREWWAARGISLLVDFDEETPGLPAEWGLCILVWTSIVTRGEITQGFFHKDLCVSLKGSWSGVTYTTCNWRGTPRHNPGKKIEQLEKLREGLRTVEEEVWVIGGDWN